MDIYLVQVGVGMLLFQQFGGINAIAYYATSIFEKAGKLRIWECDVHFFFVGMWCPLTIYELKK